MRLYSGKINLNSWLLKCLVVRVTPFFQAGPRIWIEGIVQSFDQGLQRLRGSIPAECLDRPVGHGLAAEHTMEGCGTGKEERKESR
jgi:hypothetical protein